MDNFNYSGQTTMQPAYALEATQSSLIKSVFTWMGLGLLTTATVSMFVAGNQSLMSTLFSPGVFIVLILAELGVVFWLSARIMKMSLATATWSFFLYSALNGITLTPLVLSYTSESLTTTFLVTAGMFGAMALYGSTTKRDLSGLGSFLMMGLFGIIIASIVSIFMQSSALNFAIAVLGVVLFTGLTAYDVNRIKGFSRNAQEGTEDFRRFAILGALTLYLDFINLFIHLLRLLGDRRN